MEARKKCALTAEAGGKICTRLLSAVQRTSAPAQQKGLPTTESHTKILANSRIGSRALGRRLPSAFCHQDNFCYGKAGALL